MDNRIKNLMTQIQEWVEMEGGDTGKLILEKSWDKSYEQWVVRLRVINPESTWVIGK